MNVQNITVNDLNYMNQPGIWKDKTFYFKANVSN